MTEIKATILNATLTRHPSGSFVIMGIVDNHPDYEAGTTIRTSALKSMDFEKGIATTRNSTYEVKF